MIEIQLNITKANIESTYYKDGHEKLFFSPTLKKITYWFLVSSGFFLLSYLVNTMSSQLESLVYLALALWVVAAFFLINGLVTVIKWRNSITKYANDVAKYKHYSLILNANSFSYIYDGNEIIEKWSEVKKVDMNNYVIRMYAANEYIFPKESMLEYDFTILKDFIRNHVSGIE